MDWSIPPDAVPVYLSPMITFSIKFYLFPTASASSSPEFAWREAKAEQTQKAEELESPAAVGMFPEIMICIPFNSPANPVTPAL